MAARLHETFLQNKGITFRCHYPSLSPSVAINISPDSTANDGRRRLFMATPSIAITYRHHLLLWPTAVAYRCGPSLLSTNPRYGLLVMR